MKLEPMIIVVGFLIIVSVAAIAGGAWLADNEIRKLQNEAINRGYAKLLVDENREVQFQWIEPETNKGN
jgi:hypothetical protein